MRSGRGVLSGRGRSVASRRSRERKAEPGEGRPYERFWAQLLQWLTPEQEKTSAFDLDLFASSDRVFPGEVLDLSASLGGGNTPPGAAVTVEIQTPDGRRLPFPMAAQTITAGGKAMPGFAVKYTAEAAGFHKAIATTEVDGRKVESAPLSFFVQGTQAETRPRAVNVDLLKALAASSGGKFCEPAEVNAALAAVDNKDLAYANAVEMTRERTESGLVPNFASPLGASRDRSEPPVGALIVRELYRRFGDRWLVECVFDDLLAWNRWWHAARSLEGLLCWGSTPYTPRFGSTYEVNDVNNRQGAAYESGLDNSPMYDDVPFDADSHLMQLWDVGLNGLYVADCQALADLGRDLGRAEVEELEARGTAYASRLQSLWSEADGIFLNRPPQAGDFSAPAGRRLSPTNFYPLIGQVAAPEQAERMIREHFYNPQEFWGEWMLASIVRNDPAYPEQHYWRGRIWGPMNYLVYLGLRNYCGAGSAAAVSACQDLAAKSEALLLKEWRVNGHVHENYNAITGEGCDSSSSDRYYHWGALLALIPLLAREDLP